MEKGGDDGAPSPPLWAATPWWAQLGVAAHLELLPEGRSEPWQDRGGIRPFEPPLVPRGLPHHAPPGGQSAPASTKRMSARPSAGAP